MKNVQRLFAAILLITMSLFVTSCSSDDPVEIDRSIGITEAAIANNPLVVKQPVITEKTEGRSEIVFYVAPEAKPEQMKFAMTFTIPSVCTSDPVSGAVVDFSQGTAAYTVTNELAQLTKTYDVKCIKEKYEDALITSISIDNSGGKVVTQPELTTEGNYEFTVSETTTPDEMKAFVPTIEISEGATISPESGVVQDFTAPVVYTVTAENGHESEYTVTCIKKLYEGAKILTMEFKDNPVIAEQPVISDEGGEIKFYLVVDATPEDFKNLTPTITVSEGATISPASDVEQDFTNPVVYTVTAQNGVENNYTVTCSKMLYEGAKILTIEFKDSPMVAEQPVIPATGGDITFYLVVDATPEDFKKLTPTITISESATISPASDVEQDFTAPVVYTITAENKAINTYTVTCVRNKYTEAEMVSMTIDGNPLIESHPVINQVDKTVEFFLLPEATPADIAAIKPTFKLSLGATISPASDVAQDFTNPVTYTVTSEDGKSTTPYIVTCKQTYGAVRYDFEPWKIIGAEGKSRGYDPGTLLDPTDIKSGDDPSEPHNNWGTSNTGPLTLIGMNRAESHAVFPVDAPDGYKGRGAKLVTIKVKGGNMILQKIPHVTAGSLYLGKFVLNMASPLKSTQFGIPVDFQPEYVTLYYKYAPGELFLRSTAANPDVIVEEAGTLDECAISVVLYEVASADEASLDGTNIATATNIVAFAALEDGTAKANYTPLKLTLNYLQPYDSSKMYRLAVVCSSSKSGDTFSGAPQYIEGGVITKAGSTLYVDEVNIYYKK